MKGPWEISHFLQYLIFHRSIVAFSVLHNIRFQYFLVQQDAVLRNVEISVPIWDSQSWMKVNASKNEAMPDNTRQQKKQCIFYNSNFYGSFVILWAPDNEYVFNLDKNQIAGRFLITLFRQVVSRKEVSVIQKDYSNQSNYIDMPV